MALSNMVTRTAKRAVVILQLGTGLVSIGCGDSKVTRYDDSDSDGVVITADQHGGEIHTTYVRGIKHGSYAWYRADGEKPLLRGGPPGRQW